jgi:cyclophilin family peptidyl-prolyl cis-trans isomerase
MIISLFALLAAAQAAPAQAAPAPPAPPLPSDPIARDWRPIPDDELLVMMLAGNRTVVIRLAPGSAPQHVANVRRLAQARWWDGESVYRVQEGWVAQWGDATEKKPLPANVVKVPAAEYDTAAFAPAQRLTRADAYSTASGITADGWPVATDGKASWVTHCYGTVGVARDSSPDTGSGSELFTPIGQAARRLDRNYTIVGRVIEGMQYLSALTRSDAPLGVYATAPERTPIVSVRLASDIPAAERPHFEYRAADNPRFAAMLDLKLHPKGLVSLGGIDVCDVPLAARRVGVK